jgi:hypothetical protein
MSTKNCSPPIQLQAAVFITLIFHLFLNDPLIAQGGRYWDQNLNSEAALLSGVVVGGEGGIAAIYYNPATISQMTRNNLSLSANLFSLYFIKGEDALGKGLPADRVQLNIYPRIITLTLNPKKRPDLTIELAYFTKTNDYLVVNKGIALTSDIIASNPGDEYYAAEYYIRSKFQDYNGGAGFGYRVSDKLSLGFSGLISYKDDQYYNLITADAFTLPAAGNNNQYLADSRYHLKYNMFDVRLVTKLGLHYKQNAWSFGANVNLPSLKIFGNGTVVKQVEYSNIHTEPGNPDESDLFYAGRQKKCPAHFKDPLSIAAGANFYSPSGRSILLFTAEYFFGLDTFKYIEASDDPGEDGYNFSPVSPSEWLSFASRQKPVYNMGVAFKQIVNSELTLSGGFRTDFKYMEHPDKPGFMEVNKRSQYAMNVYHFNSGMGYNFRRGSITLGMQFSYGQENNQNQIINFTEPVEYISDKIMALTGPVNNVVMVRYFDVSVYFGFMFNFMKE